MDRRNFLKCTLPLAFSGTSSAASSNTPELTFGVIADPQYADQDTRGSRFYRNSLGKLESAIKELNQLPLDFVITLGDIIDTDFASFAKIMPLYDKLRAPSRFVPGNHDFDVADADKAKVLAALRMKKPYESKVHEGWRTISLDGTEVSTFRQPANDPRTQVATELLKKFRSEKRRQAASWNAAMASTQLAWLESELDAAKAKNQRAILFNHYPILPANDPHNLWNAEELVDLLARYDHIAAYMNGHNHKGNYATHHGCHYVNLKGMVETESKSAYAVVRCFADRIEIDGLGTEPDRKLR
jgi:3',5'-cyclic AMP phosphodiesterase CpdA